MKKIFFIFLILSAMNTQAQDGCGSVEKYKSTHQWEDLPGCIGGFKEGKSDWDSPESLMSYAKENFRKFYDVWSQNKMIQDGLHPESFVFDCENFKHSGAKEKWNTDPKLKAAEVVFNEEAKRIKEAYNNFDKNWKKTLTDMYQSSHSAVMMMGQIEKIFAEEKGKKVYHELAKSERTVLQVSVDEVKEYLQKAAASKVPDAMIIPGSFEIPDMSLLEIRTIYLPKWIAYSNTADKKAIEMYEAQMAPYLKLLTGDKAKEFKANFGATIYGSGGKKLNTPQEIAAADTWYYSGAAICTVCPRWKISGVRFKGMNIAGRIGRTEGYGMLPPASAFK